MNELDEVERRVLQGARRALSPSSADAERVLAATLTALGAAPALPATRPGHTRFGARAGLLSKVSAALVIAGISGAIGYLAGYQAAQPNRPKGEVLTAAPAVVPAAPQPTDSAHETAPSQAEESTQATPASPPDTASRRRTARAVRPAVTSEPVPEPPKQPSLGDELAAVKLIERALRNDEPNVALELLDELDERMPQGALGEERLAASVMARCALGIGPKHVLRHEFASRHPSSAYLERVQRACVP